MDDLNDLPQQQEIALRNDIHYSFGAAFAASIALFSDNLA
jgi:hypothetical protein